MPPRDRPAQAARRLFLAASVSLLVAACAGRGERPGAADTKRTNKVAVLVPLSGPDAVVGRALGNAARLAMVDTGTNAFELTLHDSADRGAAAATARAIAGGNDLILGPLRSEDVTAAASVARQARVPVIAFSNDAAAAGPGAYVLGFTPSQAVERVTLQAVGAGARRFAAVVPASTYGERVRLALLATATRAGADVVGIETYASPTEARSAVRRLASRNYDALLIGDGGRVAAQVAPLAPAGARLLGTELWAAGELGGTPRLRGAWYAAPTQGRWSQFVQRYRARYGGQIPPRIASLGYDAVLLAVRAARSWPQGRRFPLGAIDERDGFDGVDGLFRFRSDNVAQRAFEVRQVTASGSALVSPAPSSF